jgi:serine/threonine protein phosphatase PrpC
MGRFAAYGRQVIGSRSRQEDAWKVVTSGEDYLLAAVADGLGGHPRGDVASRHAVEALAAVVEEEASALRQRPSATLRRAARAIDMNLRSLSETQPELEGMATTLASLYFARDRVYRLSIGDSLIYRCSGERVQRWNVLHESKGGYITSCLGYTLESVDCPARGALLHDDDRFLIASDGIELLDEQQIANALSEANSPKILVEHLLDRVDRLQSPYQDNTTLVAVFC